MEDPRPLTARKMIFLTGLAQDSVWFGGHSYNHYMVCYLLFLLEIVFFTEVFFSLDLHKWVVSIEDDINEDAE